MKRNQSPSRPHAKAAAPAAQPQTPPPPARHLTPLEGYASELLADFRNRDKRWEQRRRYEEAAALLTLLRTSGDGIGELTVDGADGLARLIERVEVVLKDLWDTLQALSDEAILAKPARLCLPCCIFIVAPRKDGQVRANISPP
jgi:hypothetical protein